MKYHNVLFDLDGTITDPKEGITKSVQYALAKLGIHEADLDRLESFIGPPLQKSFMDNYAFEEDKAWQAVAYYRDYFKEQGILQNLLFPGIDELLRNLQSQGRRVILATSKPTIFAIRILEHFRLSPYFTYAYGSELDGVRSDKSELIRYIVEEHGLNPSVSVMVGDRKHDIIGAQNNGLDSIGVGFGYGSKEELELANPTYVFDSVNDLARAFSLEAGML